MNTQFANNQFGISAQVLGMNANLQPVLDQFLSMSVGETGWTWGAALDTAIQVAAEFGHDVEFEKTPLGRFLASEIDGCPGLTWGGAIEMSLDNGTDFQLGHNEAFERFLAEDAAEVELAMRELEPAGDIFVAKGWTYADALDESLACRKEARIYGNRRLFGRGRRGGKSLH